MPVVVMLVLLVGGLGALVWRESTRRGASAPGSGIVAGNAGGLEAAAGRGNTIASRRARAASEES